MRNGVAPYQKVGDHVLPKLQAPSTAFAGYRILLTAAATFGIPVPAGDISLPGLSGGEESSSAARLQGYSSAGQEGVQSRLIIEVRDELRIDRFTYDQRPVVRSFEEGLLRGLSEAGARRHNVNQDIGIDRDRHRPRTSSMYSSVVL